MIMTIIVIIVIVVIMIVHVVINWQHHSEIVVIMKIIDFIDDSIIF